MDQTSQVTGRPYFEKKQEGFILRRFSEDTSSFELVWHRDKEDRVIEVLQGSGWKFQLDNDLPQLMDGKTFIIPKDTYHRVIKGNGDLVVKIWQKD